MSGTEGDELGSAARALADAVSQFTRAVGQNLTEASKDVGGQLASSLRDASRELAEASSQLAEDVGGPRRQRADTARNRVADRRRARAERTRVELVDAARTVFAEKGYEGASVGDVADEAGYTKGAVYANFAGKEDLLLAIVRRLLDEDEARFGEALGRPVHDVVTPDLAEGGLRETLLAVEVVGYGVRHASSREEVRPLLAARWEHAARLLAAARGGPGAEPTVDDRDAALAVIAVRALVTLLHPVLGDQVGESGARAIDRLLGGGAEPPSWRWPGE